MLWDRGRTLAYADDDDLVLDETDDAAAIPKSVVIDDSFDWEGDQLLRRPWDATVIYELHVKGFTQQMPGVREDLRGTYAGLASDAAIAHLVDLGVTAVELLPIHHIADEHFLQERGPDELLGLLDDRLPRAARRLRRDRDPRRAGARVQGPRQGDAPGRDRGDPRRGLQPHRRGQPPRPDAVVQGRRQLRLLPDDARRPPLLQGLHGHRQLAQPGEPVGAAADHGLAALLRPRVPRRRLPVRPRLGARARVPRRRPALGLLRHHPPGSGALPGEADRRAVGRRRGRLPGRQLPRSLDRVERDVPRHDARLLARPERRRAPSRSGSRARATSTSPTAGARSRRSTTSPATTASRCATSSPTTSGTTRRTSRTTRTARPTTARGTAASRARRTIRRSTSSATGRSATSSRR